MTSSSFLSAARRQLLVSIRFTLLTACVVCTTLATWHGKTATAHFISFANGVHRSPYHREDLPVVCSASATSFRLPPTNGPLTSVETFSTPSGVILNPFTAPQCRLSTPDESMASPMSSHEFRIASELMVQLSCVFGKFKPPQPTPIDCSDNRYGGSSQGGVRPVRRRRYHIVLRQHPLALQGVLLGQPAAFAGPLIQWANAIHDLLPHP